MVSKEVLDKRFYIFEDKLYFKNGPKKNKLAGHETSKGYLSVSFVHENKLYKYQAHRIIFCMTHGYIPDLIDHIDQNPKNNKIENLRPGDKRINMINTSLPSNNTSGYKGVRFEKNAWTAYIKNHQKKIHLGRFRTYEDAVLARQQAESKYWNDVGGNEESP